MSSGAGVAEAVLSDEAYQELRSRGVEEIFSSYLPEAECREMLRERRLWRGHSGPGNVLHQEGCPRVPPRVSFQEKSLAQWYHEQRGRGRWDTCLPQVSALLISARIENHLERETAVLDELRDYGSALHQGERVLIWDVLEALCRKMTDAGSTMQAQVEALLARRLAPLSAGALTGLIQSNADAPLLAGTCGVRAQSSERIVAVVDDAWGLLAALWSGQYHRDGARILAVFDAADAEEILDALAVEIEIRAPRVPVGALGADELHVLAEQYDAILSSNEELLGDIRGEEELMQRALEEAVTTARCAVAAT